MRVEIHRSPQCLIDFLATRAAPPLEQGVTGQYMRSTGVLPVSTKVDEPPPGGAVLIDCRRGAQDRRYLATTPSTWCLPHPFKWRRRHEEAYRCLGAGHGSCIAGP